MIKERPIILIISFSNLNTDPRVYRQISFLKDGYRVHTVGFSPSYLENTSHYNVSNRSKNVFQKMFSAMQLLLGFFNHYYHANEHIEQTKKYLQENTFDLIIANDIDALPVVIDNKKNAKIIFDAHEYSPREFEDKFVWRLFFQRYKTHLCQKYIPLADHMLTVCEGIAQEYLKEFGVLPSVITNAPMYEPDLKPSDVYSEKIKIIHHGGAIDSRKIELMIETMQHTDSRFELYLMLVPTQPNYYEALKQSASQMKNVFFLEPIPMQNIAQMINQFDIGLYILESNSFNNKYALPNKFFEFIQARLCVAIAPSVEMAKLVKKYHLGIVTESFNPQEMALTLNALTNEAIISFKNHCDQAAYELSAEKNRLLLNQIVQQTIGIQ